MGKQVFAQQMEQEMWNHTAASKGQDVVPVYPLVDETSQTLP